MLLLSALALAPPPLAAGTPVQSALKFFEGETRSDGTLKIMWGKQRRSRSVGQGTIRPDGSLSLVQKVDDEGKPPHERRWLIRPVAPGRYSGTMSQAQCPAPAQNDQRPQRRAMADPAPRRQIGQEPHHRPQARNGRRDRRGHGRQNALSPAVGSACLNVSSGSIMLVAGFVTVRVARCQASLRLCS